MGFLHIFFKTADPTFGGMHMTERQYERLVGELAPKSPIWKDCLNAFWIGGLICALGQLIMNGYMALELDQVKAERDALLARFWRTDNG